MDKKLKWVYTFFLLLFTIGWAYITIMAVFEAMLLPDPINVIEASGTSVLLGALIVWNGNVNQYWFRKKDPPSST